MSFPTKTDPYLLADGTALVVTDVDDGNALENLEILGQNGGIVLEESFGEKASPSVTGKLKADLSWSAGAHALGDVSTWGDAKKVALESITITTTAGAAASISWSGKEVQAGAVTGCKFPIPALALKAWHHAQILFSAFTLSGTGVHLVGATYTISGKIELVTKDGVILGFDISAGKIEAALTLRKLGSVDPTITPGTGWVVTAPLSSSSPDSDYPTLTATLTKALDKTEAADAA